jgi:hypothetical protein
MPDNAGIFGDFKGTGVLADSASAELFDRDFVCFYPRIFVQMGTLENCTPQKG